MEISQEQAYMLLAKRFADQSVIVDVQAATIIELQARITVLEADQASKPTSRAKR